MNTKTTRFIITATVIGLLLAASVHAEDTNKEMLIPIPLDVYVQFHTGITIHGSNVTAGAVSDELLTAKAVQRVCGVSLKVGDKDPCVLPFAIPDRAPKKMWAVIKSDKFSKPPDLHFNNGYLTIGFAGRHPGIGGRVSATVYLQY